MNKGGYIYILTNKNKTTLYIGVTNDLCRGIFEHKNHLINNSFTDRYNLEYCIYYEYFEYFALAIHRETGNCNLTASHAQATPPERLKSS